MADSDGDIAGGESANAVSMVGETGGGEAVGAMGEGMREEEAGEAMTGLIVGDVTN